jgi:hypothetical protein
MQWGALITTKFSPLRINPQGRPLSRLQVRDEHISIALASHALFSQVQLSDNLLESEGEPHGRRTTTKTH